MLDILRANTRSVFTYLILGGIIVVFVVSFGPGSFAKQGSGCSGGAPSYAARVNGEAIPALEWDRQYNQLFRFYQQQMGEGFTRELAEQLGLRGRALDQVVEQALVVQEARNRGLVVTDRELAQAVYDRSGFQNGGSFDKTAYEEATRSSFGSPAKYEAWLRDQMLREKMLAAVAQTVKVSDAEVKETWQSGADRAELAFVRFPVAALQGEVKVTDAEVKAFAEKQGARVAQFYKDNAARFDQKKKVRVRHVLARVAANAPAEADEAARKKIETAAGRVKGGEDFGKVAQQLSDDTNTKDRGGDLGFVAEGLADEAFAKAALALAPGQLSDPVRSASGWHLLKAEEVVPAKQVSLDQARPEIARELLVQDGARRLATEKARAALEAAKKGKSLADLFPPAGDAAQKGAKKPVAIGGAPVAADDTGPFSVGSPLVPKIGQAPELAAAAAGAKAGDVLPQVYDTPAGPVVAVVKLRERPDPAAFEKQKDELAGRVRRAKEELVRRSWVDELKGKAKIEQNPGLLTASARPVEE